MKELEEIVQRMIDAGETEDNIKLVIEEYTANVEKTNGSQTEDATAEPVDMASKSEDTSSESKEIKRWGGLIPIEVDKKQDTKKENDDISSIGAMASNLGLGFVEFAKNISSLTEQIELGVTELLTPGEMTEEQRQVEMLKIKAKRKAGLGTIPAADAFDPIISKLEENIPEYSTGTITEDFEKGNYAQGAERAVNAALRSAPSLVAAALGPGGLIALASSSAGGKFEEEFKADPSKTSGQLLLNAGVTGTTEALFELATRGIIKRAGILKEAGNAEAAKQVIKSGAAEIAKRLGISLTQEAASEMATELAVAIEDKITLGKDINTKDLMYRLGDAGIVGSLVGGSVSSVGEVGKVSKAAKERAEYILAPQEIKNQLTDKAKEINVLAADLSDSTPEGKVEINNKINELTNDIINIKKRNSNILSNIKGQDLTDYAISIDEAAKQAKRIKEGTSESEVKLAQQKYDNAISTSNAIAEASIAKAVEQNISKVEKVSKKTFGDDVEIKRLNSEEVKEFVEDVNKDLDEESRRSLVEESAQSQGFFDAKTVDGKQVIVVNTDVASKTYGVNIAGHEFLHKTLLKTLQDNPETQKALGSALINEMAEMDLKQVAGSRFAKRLEQYAAAPENVQGEEILTILSDSLVNGDLNFNESVFTKLGDVIRRFLQDIGFKSVKFDSGKDVYNFIKDYNKSIEKGRMVGAIKEAATKGVEGRLIKDKTQDIEDDVTKFSREVASQEVQDIYDQQGESGMFDIFEKFKPITTRIARRFREVPGYDEQLIIDEIETGQRGMIDLIRAYKPESGVPLAAYINKFLPARSIEAGNRILKTEFEADVTEARGVIAEEAVEQQPERKTKLKVLADQLNVADKVKSEVAEANIDPNTLTNFKSVPNAAINTVGELLGISPTKIKSKANLTAAEVASAQRWFNKNAQFVIDALPQGFDTEGKATGVPKTVLDALYTKREARAKTKAGLRTQVKRPNIKNSELLELVDIIDGKPTRNRNTSARIIALSDLLGKVMTNQEIRQTFPGVERIRSGMSEVMFSKAIRDLGENKQSILFEKLAEVTAEINPAYVNVKNTKDVVRSLKEIYGKEFSAQEINKIAKELSKLSEIYEPVVSNKKVIPEKTWTEFVAENFDQAADNIIEAIQLTIDGETPTGASLYDNIEFVARGRRAVIELGNNLLENGKSIEEVARIMAVLKPMYASSSKIGRGKISVDKNGNLFVVDGNKFGSPRGQVFNNVEDFENNAVLKIQGMTPEIWKSTNKKLLAQKSKDAVKNPNYNERLSEAKEAREAIDLMMNFFNKSEFHNDLDIAMFMISNLSNMGAPLRRAANLQYIADAVLKMNVNDLGKLAEYEHLIPANYMAIKIIQAYKSGEEVNVDNLYKNYKVAVIPKTMDDIIKRQGLQSKMHAGYDFDNDSSTDRYYNFLTRGFDGIVPIRDISNNQQIGVAFSKPGKDIKISENISNVRPVLQYSKESRGMSTFDFDETLIIDGENFVTATKDGDVVKIPSDKWPIDGPKLAEEGYSFDFSDFVNVRGGKEGPLLQKMKNQIKKYGSGNVFVLTARMQEAAEPIHEWLKSQGINIPLENITGLGKSEGDAKAQWFIDKYAEGYNDMYFVDDALPNVKAVKHVFDQLDIKGKSVQARLQFSKEMSSEFNKMIERKKSVGAEKVFSSVVGQKRGKNIGKYRFFVPPSADDFAGLLYDFYGKGKQGDKDMEFMKKALLDPFARADREMSMARMSILDDYKTLRKELPNVKKKLGKIIDKDTGFTFDNAVRVYLFDKAGFEVPGISKRDLAYLKNVVNTDQDLKTFADTLGLISKKKEGYIKPGENWSVETIASDLENIVNKIGRKQYLAEWIENKNIIFSPENLNKIEAVYGTRFREALEDSLYRMENGTNRSAGKSYGQSWTNWVNGSVGAIMFFNARSAVLQTLSTVNFINYADNNIFAAGKALANQKQYWSDFSTLFNSDFLRARRAGLQINVNEAELANAVAGAQNKAKAALAYLLKKGFLPTQIADSFAIASGGATFYRNRIKTYVKQGMDQKAAEEKAFLDFQEIAQETQQSSRPDRISQQQASPLGRLILAFANTPLQYNRLIKKAAIDLANGRGDWRSNMSRILYYGAIQNVIFASLQQAIFALSFDDEDDEEVLDKKTMRVLNGTIDTLLRGSGVTGAAVATIKNVILKFMEQSEKGFRADYGEVIVEGLQVSPPMGSKARKVYGALKTYKFNKDVMGEMDTFDYNNPVWDAVGNVTSAATNVPLDRLIRKTDNIREAFNQENSAMQRAFLLLGWSAWDLRVGERVVVNKGRDNEYVKFLPLKQQAQKEAEKKADERAKKEKQAKQQRCTKIKSDGTRCKVMVNKPKTRCHYHD